MSRGDVNLDFRRRDRLGFDEAILCGPKSAAQLVSILEQADDRDASLLLTRLESTQLEVLPEALRVRIDYDPVSRTGFYGDHVAPRGEPRVGVLTAGTSDATVGREVIRTLEYYGEPSLDVADVGVAGLWRLLDRVEELRKLAALVVVAGMDGALPSVVAGLVPGVVISVPTSVGYGVAAGGHAALHSALASCAPGVVVVNIDNGYGAACAVLRVLRCGATGAG